MAKKLKFKNSELQELTDEDIDKLTKENIEDDLV